MQQDEDDQAYYWQTFEAGREQGRLLGEQYEIHRHTFEERHQLGPDAFYLEKKRKEKQTIISVHKPSPLPIKKKCDDKKKGIGKDKQATQ